MSFRNIGSVLLAFLAAFVVMLIDLHYYQSPYLDRLFYTFIALAIILALFKVVLENAITRGIKDSKTRYSARKFSSILYIAIFLVVLGTIWIENIQSLVVVYGLVGAGIAIALQDVFKRFAGGLIIFLNKPYSAP